MKQQLLSLAQHPQLAARLKRAALYAAISVLACLGPFLYRDGSSAALPGGAKEEKITTWEDVLSLPEWGALDVEEQKQVREGFVDHIVMPKFKDDAEREQGKLSLIDKADPAVFRANQIANFDNGNLGASIRGMLFGSCLHTVAHHIGIAAGFFGAGVSEEWAAARLKSWFAAYSRNTAPVRVAGYVGRWAGWWLCFLVLRLVWRGGRALKKSNAATALRDWLRAAFG